MVKRIFSCICALFASISLALLVACDKEEKSDAVNLFAIDGSMVGTAQADYFVVHEPAASTKVNAMPTLNFAGDLQSLYGGENGYPQAVIVVKKEISDYTVAGEFLEKVAKNPEWLLSENTSASTIVEAVRSHLPKDMAPTFTENNLTKSVIKNCGIKLVSAADGKSEITDFMQKINAVGSGDFGTPKDSFFHSGEFSKDSYKGKLKVYAPDGAPALGIASLLAGVESLQNEAEYHVVNATTIQTFVNGENPAADICILPVNVAVKALGSGEKYKLLGTLTHGNLYLLSNGGEKITKNNLGYLKGKKVGVINLAAVPGLTFKMILKAHDIEYTELN